MNSRPKTKVLMLLPNLVGAGGQRAVLNLFHALDRRRFDVTLLVQERLGAFVKEVEHDRCVEFLLDREYRRSDLPMLLRQTVRRAKTADVVLGGLEGRASFSGLAAAKVLRKPFVAWIHIDWKPFLALVSWRQKLALKAILTADRVVACSHGAAKGFAECLNAPASLIQTIYNGIPSSRVLAAAAVSLPDGALSIFERPTVVTVGRLDPQKGHTYLIEAHALLLKQGVAHNLVIIGEGGLLAPLQAQARSLSVENSVYFLGFQDNPHRFIKRATVFALSSTFEGFGLVIAEALICGTPIVSTDCPSGPREVLDGGRYGVLVRPKDAVALAEGIRDLLLDAPRREMLAEAGLRRGEYFDEKASVAEWERLFTEFATR